MDYRFENLGPERFQEFCQSLLLLSFPNLQCFPVGQRDGGRDAIQWSRDPYANQFIVFQVKFVRNPSSLQEPHKWLTKTIEKELPKISSLITQGAKEYYLITNIPGTAFEGFGSIDKVQDLLHNDLKIPSQCWWRDDLSRRLDTYPGLKWSYPEIISAADFLQATITEKLNDDKERRTRVIKAFLRDQFEKDKEVRFKQVELHNQLFDLFVDIPASHGTKVKFGYKKRPSLGYPSYTNEQIVHDSWTGQAREELGAASIILKTKNSSKNCHIILEGAPGQGKSTITQYICQIHRSFLLQEHIPDNVPRSHHKDISSKLPFRIDLRDLASWISNKNPFSTGVQENIEPKTLETFLAAQVAYYSGGHRFDTEDLLSIFRLSSVLLAFDGLDEVADLSRRQDVMDEIVKGLTRLQENSLTIQAIVTSRPTAFNMQTNPLEKLFSYLELGPIDKANIDLYAEKWIKAKRLHSKEASEIRSIVKEKLTQTHIRELARNPMQLAILMSLVHTRGVSLPDKRTALYDSYMDLFFNREAEKSQVVREHRELLMSIHGYVAWILHSSSETDNDRGSISHEKLQSLMESYLTSEDHDTTLVSTLFSGMVERVVALVSRIEGTYEFEVQPLREYFAARYLYETAPYSPTGKERSGTLPDRFNALVKNYYWINVARFYAGRYSKGELPSLHDCLEELTQAEGYSYTSYPQEIAATLLSDWVFSQQPRLMKKIVALILQGTGLRKLLISGRSRRHHPSNSLILPQNCGRDELIHHCFDLLRSNTSTDYAYYITKLINANGNQDEIYGLWMDELAQSSKESKLRWIEYGLFLGTLQRLQPVDIETVYQEQQDKDRFSEILFRSGNAQFFESTEAHFDNALNLVLSKFLTVSISKKYKSILELIAFVLNVSKFYTVFSYRTPLSLDSSSGFRHADFKLDAHHNKDLDYINAKKCYSLLAIAKEEFKRSGVEWSSDIRPWETIVEVTIQLFGKHLSIINFVNIAAGIKSKESTFAEAKELFNDTISLCKRVRYARLRAGNPKWWIQTLQLANSTWEKSLCLLICTTWCSQQTLLQIINHIDELVTSLDNRTWQWLHKSLNESRYFRNQENMQFPRNNLNSLPRSLQHRTILLLTTRATDRIATEIYSIYKDTLDLSDQATNTLRERVGYYKLRYEANKDDALLLIKDCYSKMRIDNAKNHYGTQYFIDPSHLTNSSAIRIVTDPSNYPIEILRCAETFLRVKTINHPEPVINIAKKEKWFLTTENRTSQ